MWWAGLYFAQPPKARKKPEKVSSDPMATAPRRSLCSDLLSGPKETVPRGLGIIEDRFMGAAADSQLDETLYRLRKQSQSFRADYMGTFTKPQDMEYLNDLIANHNPIARNKHPIRSQSTPSFFTVMDKDKQFNESIRQLYQQKQLKEGKRPSKSKSDGGKAEDDFFKHQKAEEKAARGKRQLQELLLGEPNAPSVVASSNETKKGPQPPKDTAQRKVITKALQEELLMDYYSMYQYFEKDYEPPTTHKTVAELFSDFLEFVMFLYGMDETRTYSMPGAFKQFYEEVSFEQGPSLCTNEWLTNVRRLQLRARADHEDPPRFAERHESDLLDLFRLLMDQSGPTRGCLTYERFLGLEPIAEFMFDVVQQSRILGSNTKGIEKARSLQTIRKTGYVTADKAADQNKRMSEIYGAFREGKHAALVKQKTEKQDWIDEDAVKKKEMLAKAKAEAEAAAAAAEAEGGAPSAPKGPIVKMKTKRFVHNTDGTVAIFDED
jgi:hypothetical protein